MLLSFFKTARVLCLTIILAVFFSAAGYGADSSLYSLETALNDLIYRLSHSVVTVEASTSVRLQSTDVSDETVHSLVSSGIVFDSLGHVLVAASSAMAARKATSWVYLSMTSRSVLGSRGLLAR